MRNVFLRLIWVLSCTFSVSAEIAVSDHQDTKDMAPAAPSIAALVEKTASEADPEPAQWQEEHFCIILLHPVSLSFPFSNPLNFSVEVRAAILRSVAVCCAWSCVPFTEYDHFVSEIDYGIQFIPIGGYLRGFLVNLYMGIGSVDFTPVALSLQAEVGYQDILPGGFTAGVSGGVGCVVGEMTSAIAFAAYLDCNIGYALPTPGGFPGRSGAVH